MTLPENWNKDEQRILGEAQGLHRADKSINEDVYKEVMADFATLKGGKQEQTAIMADLKEKQLLPDVHVTDADGRMALDHPGDTTPIEQRADAIDALAGKALKGDAQAKADLEKALVDMRNTTSLEYREALVDQLQQNGSSHLNLIPHLQETTMPDGREAYTFTNFRGTLQVPISDKSDVHQS